MNEVGRINQLLQSDPNVSDSFKKCMGIMEEAKERQANNRNTAIEIMAEKYIKETGLKPSEIEIVIRNDYDMAQTISFRRAGKTLTPFGESVKQLIDLLDRNPDRLSRAERETIERIKECL